MLRTLLLTSALIIGAHATDLSMNFDKNTISEIRKIKVYKYPSWVCKIKFSNNKTIFFVSPKSMFEFYFNKKKWALYDAKTIEDLEDVVVTDYQTLDPVNAKKAYFVYGSTKTSPAGDDLVAFKNEEDAKNFADSNRGRRIFRFSEIQNSLIRLLNGRI